MNRALPGASLFPAACDRSKFLTLVGSAADETDVEVHAYCLMDTHFHLLVRTRVGAPSEFVGRFASPYAKYLGARLGVEGPLFRGRFTSRTLRSERYVITVARYIHRNAVDIVGEHGLADYPWSSLRAYVGLAVSPSWLRTTVIVAE